MSDRGERGGKGKRPAGAKADSPAVAVRVGAVRVIERMLDGEGSLTRLLPAAQASLPASERALLQAYVFGLARWSGQLEALLGTLLERPLKARDRDVDLLLRLGLFQLVHTRTPPHAAVDATVAATRALDKPWARGLVNGVLRNALRRGEALLDPLDERARLSHPPWLLARLREDWPERWRELAEAGNVQAPMTLRVNLARTDVPRYREALAAAALSAEPLAPSAPGRAPAALVLERAVAVDALPGFEAGLVSVQDGAAQLAVEFLIEASSPGARLLDACAAPGGKTAQALESGHFGAVVALDRDPERLGRVRETLERLGFPTEPEEGTGTVADTIGTDTARDVGAGPGAAVADASRTRAAVTLGAHDAADTARWWDGVPFDAVLLDAPCTGTGVIRRHPDIKLLRRESDVTALAVEQGQLLDALWATLRPGGVLLYATCSVLRAEGEAQTAAFLSRQPNATLRLERRVLSGESGMDGFYHALLERAP